MDSENSSVGLSTRKPFVVAHVTQSLDVGGQERLLVEFAKHHDRSEFQLHVVSLGDRGKLAKALEEQGCVVHALESPAGLKISLIRRLARLFREIGARAVHTHDDRPLIHGTAAAWWAGVARRIHTHHHGDLPTLSPRQHRLVAWASRLTHVFYCVSDDSSRFMARQGVPDSKRRTLRNGIDLTRFSYMGPAIAGPAVVVARLSPEKDIATLLRATALILDKRTDFRLWIVGDGACRPELEALRSSLHLGSAVEFLGERNDIPALLEQARLFVLPSQTEGISLTILEAMARGLPVVTTRVGGNPEVVIDGETGVLVDPRSPEELAAAIIAVWNQAGRLETMGRFGRLRVEQHFDIRKMVAAYEAAYDPRRLETTSAPTSQPVLT